MSELAGGSAGAGAGTSSGGAGAPPAAGAPSGGANGVGAPSPTGGTPAGAGAAASDWTTGLNDEFKGFVQNKGWKGSSDVIDSYRNLEKLIGAPQERIAKIPEKDDDAEGWNNIYTKLGRPATAEGYKIEVPKEGGNPEFAKWAAETFHGAGLNNKQAAALAGKWNEYIAGVNKAQADGYATKVTAEVASLKKEWGAAFDQNMAIGKRAAVGFGLDTDTLNKIESALGVARTVKLFHDIGSKMGEDSFVNGTGPRNPGFNGAMTPQAAQDKIRSLRADQGFIQKYTAGDSNAREEMERLHRFAYPDA